MYDELAEYYARFCALPGIRLERELRRLQERGYSREEAIAELYRRLRAAPAERARPSPWLAPACALLCLTNAALACLKVRGLLRHRPQTLVGALPYALGISLDLALALLWGAMALRRLRRREAADAASASHNWP